MITPGQEPRNARKGDKECEESLGGRSLSFLRFATNRPFATLAISLPCRQTCRQNHDSSRAVWGSFSSTIVEATYRSEELEWTALKEYQRFYYS